MTNDNADILADVIDTATAASILGISTAAVGQKFTAGTIPGKRLGLRTLVFHRPTIEAIAAERAKQ
jgi:hypothetical protein